MPSSVNLLFFTTCSCPFRAFIMPALSVTERFEILRQGQLKNEEKLKIPGNRSTLLESQLGFF
jgi:hypothetical protein